MTCVSQENQTQITAERLSAGAIERIRRVIEEEDGKSL